eukprot:COSAG03_NODE_14_length_22296_cov_10.813128_12_plen_80_part_00
MSVGDDEAELQLTQVTTAVALPDTAAAAGAATEEEVYLPPPDAVDEDPDQALPTEVTEDLVSSRSRSRSRSGSRSPTFA